MRKFHGRNLFRVSLLGIILLISLLISACADSDSGNATSTVVKDSKNNKNVHMKFNGYDEAEPSKVVVYLHKLTSQDLDNMEAVTLNVGGSSEEEIPMYGSDEEEFLSEEAQGSAVDYEETDVVDPVVEESECVDPAVVVEPEIVESELRETFIDKSRLKEAEAQKSKLNNLDIDKTEQEESMLEELEVEEPVLAKFEAGQSEEVATKEPVMRGSVTCTQVSLEDGYLEATIPVQDPSLWPLVIERAKFEYADGTSKSLNLSAIVQNSKADLSFDYQGIVHAKEAKATDSSLPSARIDVDDINSWDVSLNRRNIGSIEITGVNFQPRDVDIYYTDGWVETPLYRLSTGTSYDKETQNLVAFIDLTGGTKVIRKIYIRVGDEDKGDVYEYGYVGYLSNSNKSLSLNLKNFDSDGWMTEDPLQQHYAIVRLSNVFSNPYANISVKYTEGDSSQIRSVDVGAYDDYKHLYTFSKIVTENNYVTLKEVRFGFKRLVLNRRIDFTTDEHALVILDSNDFESTANEFYFKVINVPKRPSYVSCPWWDESLPEDECMEEEHDDYLGDYDSQRKVLSYRVDSVESYIKPVEFGIDDRKIDLRYYGKMYPGETLEINYNDMIPEKINYTFFVKNLNSKPNSIRAYYKEDGSSAEKVLSFVYDVDNKRARANFSAKGSVTITKVLLNNYSYTKPVQLNSSSTSKSISFSDMTVNMCTAIVSGAPKGNLLKMTYRYFNSSTGQYLDKTYVTYNASYSTAGNYWFKATPSQLNGVTYDKIQLRKITIDNATFNAENYYISAGDRVTIPFSRFTKNSTKYAVNVRGDWSVLLNKICTMEYEENGKTHTATGVLKCAGNNASTDRYYYASPYWGYQISFTTVSTKANSIKVKVVKIGDKVYKYSFTLKYNQNAGTEDINQGINTRTLDLDTNFKNCAVSYTVRIKNAPSGGTIVWGRGTPGTKKSLSYVSSTRTATCNIGSSSNIYIGTIDIDSKKSTAILRLTPENSVIELDWKTMFGKKGSKLISKKCPSCKGTSTCGICHGDRDVACSAAKFVGAKHCYWCNDSGKTECVKCYGGCSYCTYNNGFGVCAGGKVETLSPIN